MPEALRTTHETNIAGDKIKHVYSTRDLWYGEPSEGDVKIKAAIDHTRSIQDEFPGPQIADRIQNHFTLSRDQTAANDDLRTRLLALEDVTRPVEIAPRPFQLDSRESIDIGSMKVPPDSRNGVFGDVKSIQIHPPATMRERETLHSQYISSRQRKAPSRSRHRDASHLNLDLKEGVTSNAPPRSPIAKSQHAEENGDSLSSDQPAESKRYQDLLARIQSLEEENRSLKKSEAQPKFLVIYHIQHKNSDGNDGEDSDEGPISYLDAPQWSIGRDLVLLRATSPLADLEGYLQRLDDIAFVVNKYYNARQQTSEIEKAERDKTTLPIPAPIRETISLRSREMVEAIKYYVDLKVNSKQRFDPEQPIEFPYRFWYYGRRTTVLRELHSQHRNYLLALTVWIENRCKDLYDRVEKTFLEGYVSRESIPFLFTPGDSVVVHKEHTLVAGVVSSWISRARVGAAVEAETIENPMNQFLVDEEPLGSRAELHGSGSQKEVLADLAEESSRDTEKREVWNLTYWTYRFDGSFYQEVQSVAIHLTRGKQDKVKELNAYPMSHASNDTRNVLEQRARMFWKCRYKNFVSYEDKSSIHGNTDRFMVDFGTYKQLHSGSSSLQSQHLRHKDNKIGRMIEKVMESDHPPMGPNFYAFPATIVGYNLRTKNWIDLNVDQIRDVTWNKQSFSRLVIDEETKELIQALITNQIDREQSTDIVENKGNGLIILLHGGPGTGKTLTAESVAEMAEKPLFRVTCGDIGTKPEEVEKYLESVFYLSKAWDAVVLLDEADVFLEQRIHSDLERNALVSVFLRVLEYHEGILILTSNRVGTFDEAFKSRIQLALHYDNLTKGQRRKIWTNFLHHLRDMEEPPRKDTPEGEENGKKRKRVSVGVDFEDIECFLSDLAEHEMNGRQIRNAITTARQLAKFKRQDMNSSHLKHAIKVSSKFDKFLLNLNDGYSDERMAREGRIR